MTADVGTHVFVYEVKKGLRNAGNKTMLFLASEASRAVGSLFRRSYTSALEMWVRGAGSQLRGYVKNRQGQRGTVSNAHVKAIKPGYDMKYTTLCKCNQLKANWVTLWYTVTQAVFQQ